MIKNKYIALVMLVAGLGFASCDVETDEEPGGTAVEKMAGTWTVTFKQSEDEFNYIEGKGADPNLSSMSADELAKQKWEDEYGIGKITVMTSNTAANVPTEMWFIDKNFIKNATSLVTGKSITYTSQTKCSVNYDARTFEVKGYQLADGSTVDIVGGKILEGAATTPRGVKADSIVAYVKYSNEPYGFTYMKMSGYRYTGYPEDR